MMNLYVVLKENVKKLVDKGAVHILVGNFLTRFVNLFGTICLVRILTKQEYGTLGYVENLYGFLYLLVGLGLNNAIMRYVLLENSLDKKYSVFFYIVKKGSIYNLIIMCIGFLINYVYPHPTEFSDGEILLYMIILIMPFAFYIEITFSNERAFFNNKTYIYLSIATTSGIIISKILGGITFGVKGVIIFYGIFEAFAGVICILYEKHKYYRKQQQSKLKKTLRRSIDIYGMQYMLTNSLWSMFLLLDVFMLAQLLNSEEAVADYKVAYTIPACLSILSGAIGMFVSPYFIKNEKNKLWVRKNYILCFLITFIVVFIVALLIGIFSKQIVILLYGKNYLNIVPLMRVLLLAAVANAGLRFTTANILASIGEVRYNLFVSAIAIVMQVVVNLYMIPHYGILGPAITSICSYVFMGVTLFFIFNRKYEILNLNNIFKR